MPRVNLNAGSIFGSGGVMMILSPAKTLDLSPLSTQVQSLITDIITHNNDDDHTSFPSCDTKKTIAIAEAMKGKSAKSLSTVLGISSNLANVSHKYWSEYQLDPTKRSIDEQKPAIFTFKGPAYQGLDATALCSFCEDDDESDTITSTKNKNTMQYLQRNLRIIDPLYGALRPLDLIQPYRLEMATSCKNVFDNNKTDNKQKLNQWWKQSVTNQLCQEILSHEKSQTTIVVNLASDEYSSAVESTSFPTNTKYIKAVFQQEGRVLSVHAKRARGLMARYLAEKNVNDADGIRAFNLEGYGFVKSKSSEDVIVFDRKKQPPPPVAAKKKKPKQNKKEKDDKAVVAVTKKKRSVKEESPTVAKKKPRRSVRSKTT